MVSENSDQSGGFQRRPCVCQIAGTNPFSCNEGRDIVVAGRRGTWAGISISESMLRTMRLPRRTFLHLAAGAAAMPVVSKIAKAKAYPTRPVRLIVGFGPGQ